MSKEFVPAADEVWQLQHGEDPECQLFQRMARKGHDNGKHRTKQGFYVCTPSGRFLASGNSNNADRILSIMKRGLQAWHNASEDDRQLPTDEFHSVGRLEQKYPDDGLILWMVTRDLPESGAPDSPPAAKWNQDSIWYSAAEARQWLPAELTDRDPHPLPPLLAERLARFHFVDTVKGQTSAFSAEEVAGTQITTRIVERQGDLVQIVIEGQTRSESDWDWNRKAPHGIETWLTGKASFDLQAERFVEFQLVAVGRRWGQTSYHDRQQDPEKSPIGFVVELAAADAPKIPPGLCRFYDAPWLQ